MARFTKQTVNWKDMEKLVPKDQRGKFLAFKAKSDAYFRRVMANPPEPPKIDWEEYKKIVPVQGLVDKFKSEYESFKVPIPQDTLSAKVDEQWKELEPKITAFCEEQTKIIAEATAGLNKVKALPKFEDMTMETYKDLYPDLALDPVKKPSFWPHTDDEQEWYVDPTEQKKAGGH